MKFSVILVMLLTILLVTSPGFAESRAPPSSKTGHKFRSRAHVKEKKANYARDDLRRRVLIQNKFFTLSSGPSTKGPGH